jgi:hypothetical protein
MKPINMEELQSRITDWVNERQDGWTDKEARYVRNMRKQAVYFIRYNSNMSLESAYYAFEQVKQTYTGSLS